ncbi:MAG TPA: alpha/beta fold hydrolase, partial [Actinomycetota bacterium]|nr:alpha/beta fold hydrolase [Actinomycetota bacterium]
MSGAPLPAAPGAPSDIGPPVEIERRNARTAIETLLRGRIRGRRTAGKDLVATVALDLGDAGEWTLKIDRGRMSLAPDRVRRPDTTIQTDAVTLADIVSGSRAGVEAFLSGDLRVRGNLALSLRLDDLFGRPDRPARYPRARTVRAGGLSTFILEAGKGPPVVLLHGLGATNASLLPTLWDLAVDHRVIAPDLPGFGESGKPIRRYDAPFYARWLLAFLDELGIERAHLVGNSMGGRVAIETALLAQHRVDRMVLLAPSPAFIRRREFVRVVRLLR